MTDADAAAAPVPPMNYAQRLVLTFIAVVAVALTLGYFQGMPFGMACLVATPGCLMVGSMFMLLHLAKHGAAISAQKQLATLLIVEFFLVPLGAGVALVAFFALRPSNPPDAVPNWTPQPSVSSTPR